MAPEPGEVALQSRPGDDQQERGVRQPRDREVAFDAAAGIEHLGVDDTARFDIHVVGAQMLQEGERIAALDPDLAEGGHVEQAGRLAHRHVLALLVFKPVLPLPGILVFARLTLVGKPVGPLPARHFAEHRTARLELLMDRRAADAARRRHLPVGEVIGIEQPERLGHAVLQVMTVLLERLRPADVDLPQIERRVRRHGSTAPAQSPRRLTRRCRWNCSRQQPSSL